MLAELADPKAPEGSLDLAIELGDSILPHRRRFTVATSRDTVVDLLGLDPMNPRSVRHQVDGLRDQIEMLPEAEENGILSPLSAAALLAQAELATATPERLSTEALWALRGRIAKLSDLLTGEYFV